MKRSYFAFISVLFFVFIVSGCSSVSSVKKDTVFKTMKLSNYKSITVNIKSSIKNSDKLSEELKENIIAGLNKNHIFVKIGMNGDLKLNANN